MPRSRCRFIHGIAAVACQKKKKKKNPGGPARPGRSPTPAVALRLDLLWIRALCRMCSPLNIRAAQRRAQAGAAWW